MIALVLDTLTAVPWFVLTPLVRPWHLRWGATDAEVHGPMPGDDVVRRAQFNATRAISIDAQAEQVWPPSGWPRYACGTMAVRTRT